MSPEEQRIAIAEACGWKNIRASKLKPFDLYGAMPEVGRTRLPDYLNDLNAMHEAENKLNNSRDGTNYGRELSSIVLGYSNGGNHHCINYWETARLVRATATQRAEAFLKTIGKWKD